VRDHCLCGQGEFEINESDFKLYYCHCSLCRRQAGASSNTATIVAAETFRWFHGIEHVSSWVKESGLRSDFSLSCGSPVPDPLRSTPYIRVPAGLLEGGGHLEVVAHSCTSSKASWDSIFMHGTCYKELPPDLSELIALLRSVDA